MVMVIVMEVMAAAAGGCNNMNCLCRVEPMEIAKSRKTLLQRMCDQLPEDETREHYPDLVVASLGAIRKGEPNDVVTSRFVFDGTSGLTVNRRPRIRGERPPT